MPGRARGLLGRRPCYFGSMLMRWVAAANFGAELPVPLYTRAERSRSAFPMTDTELKLMAAAAIIGLKSTPSTG